MRRPRALLFDMFGTVVDWQNTVAPFLEQRAKRDATSDQLQAAVSVIDWLEFTKSWRQGYFRRTTEIRNQQLHEGFTDVDQIHLELLIELVKKHGIEGLWSSQECADINKIWHRLEGWPDSSEALKKLKKSFIIATLTNGMNAAIFINPSFN
jgi:2-haloacid dehalogenase